MQKNRGIPFTVLLILVPCSNKQTGGGGGVADGHTCGSPESEVRLDQGPTSRRKLVP